MAQWRGNHQGAEEALANGTAKVEALLVEAAALLGGDTETGPNGADQKGGKAPEGGAGAPEAPGNGGGDRAPAPEAGGSDG